ncbi:MAG TPA: substrate-binding domain-containing protein [Gammaproteobacteria bacterium]|nr:substrate-binding domain-containing protein [Gammaproteobacteria bacterium]
MNVELEIRWRIGQDAPREVDPLLFRLLHAIEQGASLRSAAIATAASYRHAWGLLQGWEQSMGTPLVNLERGRGASLSALGRSILWAERRAHSRLAPFLDSISAEVEHELAALVATALPLRLVASHDLALGVLKECMNGLRKPKLNVQYRGSLDCVRQLVAGQCDLAGFHVPHGPLGAEIESAYRRLLHPDRFTVLHFAYREQGLMLPPGNPRGIAGIEDLARTRVQFVNRQPDSGTRMLFDCLLKGSALQPADIRGYDNEEFTHLAVAAMIASGAADAGFGVEAAAARFGLDFVPLVKERYLLAMERSSPPPSWLEALTGALQGDGFRTRMRGIPGYDLADSGQVVELAGAPRPDAGTRAAGADYA